MDSSIRTLVVGTTPDYVDYIRNTYADSCCFITDAALRNATSLPAPEDGEEALADLSDFEAAHRCLVDHVRDWRLRVGGVACFDCESMELAAYLAKAWGKAYPSVDTIRLCRNKHEMKQAWRAQGVPCPESQIVADAQALHDFAQRLPGGACVVKPRGGSGSELVFLCTDAESRESAFHAIQEGLKRRAGDRLYAAKPADGLSPVAEEWIEGEEYSCDLLLDKNRIDLVRLTRKVPWGDAPFGTTGAYALARDIPGLSVDPDLTALLQRAAQALGIDHGICMADFIVRGGQPLFLELTPRPGGDILPMLLRAAGGSEILGLTLDVARGKPVSVPDWRALPGAIGVRVFARQAGELIRIEGDRARLDSRVLDLQLLHVEGHRIEMPPDDYDSWLLAHIVFEPNSVLDIEAQCREIADLIDIEIVSRGGADA